MERLTHARDAVVEAVLAGLAVGVVEGVRVAVAGRAGVLGAVAIAAAASVVMIAAAVIARAGIAVAVRAPVIAAWLRDARAGGVARTGAAWSAMLVGVVVAGFAWVAFRVFAWAHVSYRFHSADAIGALVVAVYVAAGTLLAVGALTLHRSVLPRLPGQLLDGRRRSATALGVALVMFVAVPTGMVARAVPEFDVAPVLLALLVVASVVVVMIVRVAARRPARWGALGAAVAAIAGTWMLTSLPRARLAVVEHGAPSKLTAQIVWRFADGDGDGFPGPGVGGADCDDANAARNPGALEIAGNGFDENCTGADAPVFVQPALPAPVKPPPTNIVLISVDALRADRLGSYGYARTTPVLDRLAAEGVRFTYAFTSCPSTRCAIPALHTGRFRPGPTATTIAAELKAAGYDTGAITCCERFGNPDQELAGFRTIDASADAVRMARAGQSNADAVLTRVDNWLRTTASNPFFLWIHFYEPHSPYEAPDGPDLGSSDSDRYDREVAYLDSQIAKLLHNDANTIFVITADHGEELDEHGLRFHARSLYNQVIRVPLIIRGPRITPKVVDTPVSIVDIAPTVLELAGAPIPPNLNGVSLAAATRGGDVPARPVLVELAHDHQIKRDMAAVIQPPYKVIWDREANAWSLYRIDDVADEHDISETGNELASMQRLLMETLDRETRPLLR